MKKKIALRLFISVIMHLLIGAAFVIIANLLLRNEFTIEYLEGEESYVPQNAFKEDYVFEESELYTEIYTHQIQDIISYCAIKNIIDKNENHSYDSVNILDFVYSDSNSTKLDSPVVFYIDDLIKWGRSGFSYEVKEYTVEEFMSYYDNSPYSFDDITYYCEDDVSYYVNDDGQTMVKCRFLIPEYSTIDGVTELTSLAKDWLGYYDIQDSIVYAAEKYMKYYDLYKTGIGLYEFSNSNIKYILRIGEGADKITYSNMKNGLFDTSKASDEELTEIFSDYKDYIVYFPDKLEYSTFSDVNESELYIYVRSYADEFGMPIKLWSYIEGDYSKPDDAFSIAYEATSGRKGLVYKSILFGSAIIVVYGLAFVFMCLTAGVKKKGEYYLLFTDKFFVDIYGLLFLVLLFVSRYFYLQNAESGLNNIYLVFIPLGIFTSLFMCTFVYSIIRRIRNKYYDNFSLFYVIYKGYTAVRDNIENNPNPYISGLIPFHFYFILNFGLFVVLVVSSNTNRRGLVFLCVFFIVIINICYAIREVKKASDRNSLRDGIRRIGSGELDYKIKKDKLLDINNEMADEINNIGEGIKNAVNTSMRDEKMKSDLITNVSHDLKTPLTSIINYVNLLKDENITQQPAAGYINTLEEKSIRLKQLLVDLIDASRLSSGNTDVNFSDIKITELLHQIIAEFADKLEMAGLDVVFDGESDAYISADGRHMWRLMDNLLENVCKYSLKGTRVYVSVRELPLENEQTGAGKICISIKNVSATPNTVQGNELTERFIRGDSSRSSEGSGLGLYIAKSLTELQNGNLEVIADGDLFKVDITFDILKH